MPKKSDRKQEPPATDSITQPFFGQFILTKENKYFLFLGLGIGFLFFIALQFLFPIPVFCSDTNSYVIAAIQNYPIGNRPVGYSEFISFFHDINHSTTLLVLSQYLSNLLANLFLFFSVTFFLPLKRGFKIILFVLLLCNPLYVLYSNYILTDAFFCSLTVAWFTSVLWIIYRPHFIWVLLQVIFLFLAFKIRYHALFYPAITILAFIVSKQALWKKLVGIAATVTMLYFVVEHILNETEKVTDVRTFSAFGGWELGNNALHIVKYEYIDPRIFDNEEALEFYNYSYDYFSHARKDTVDEELKATSEYLWDTTKPLRSYLNYYAYKHRNNYGFDLYFHVWTALGPLYSDFGTKVIEHNPVFYIKYFVWPNVKAYCNPYMEAFNATYQGSDTIPAFIADYYGYTTKKMSFNHETFFKAMMKPQKWLYMITNAAFVVLLIAFVVTGRIKMKPDFFDWQLYFFTAFYVGNFLFIVLLVPTVFRYHIAVITLSVVYILYLLQLFLNRQKT